MSADKSGALSDAELDALEADIAKNEAQTPPIFGVALSNEQARRLLSSLRELRHDLALYVAAANEDWSGEGDLRAETTRLREALERLVYETRAFGHDTCTPSMCATLRAANAAEALLSPKSPPSPPEQKVMPCPRCGEENYDGIVWNPKNSRPECWSCGECAAVHGDPASPPTEGQT